MVGKNYPVPEDREKNAMRPGNKRRTPISHPLGRYLFANEALCNFAISGSGPRQTVMADLLRATQGQIPVIIIHGNDTSMMGLSASIWQEKFGACDVTDHAAFWVCADGSFEPFLGMDEMDVVDTMEQLAQTAGYTCSAHFSNVVRGHLRLLAHLGCSCCLSGLYYLCSFKNITEFQGNISALKCSQQEKMSILWELGLSSDENRSQFEIFRNLIMHLAHEAKNSGWTPDNVVGSMNIATAIKNRATMLLNIDANRSEYLLQYICQELRIQNQKQFLLLIDDVQLESSGICALLKTSRLGFRFGLISENLVEMIGNEENELKMVAEKLSRLILFKHSMDTTAQTLSDLIGKEYVERTTETKSSDRKWLSWLPDRTSKSVATTREKEHRVESKDIIDLEPGQAIIFDTLSNAIIRF